MEDYPPQWVKVIIEQFDQLDGRLGHFEHTQDDSQGDNHEHQYPNPTTHLAHKFQHAPSHPIYRNLRGPHDPYESWKTTYRNV